MMHTPRVTVVIPYRKRPEVVRSIAMGLLPGAAETPLEILISEAGEPDVDTRRRLAKLLEGYPLHVLSWIQADLEFNKAFAVNIGASLSAAQALLLLDADVILPHNFLPVVMREVREGVACCLKQVAETEGPANVRPAPGIMFLTKSDFIAVGGMTSELTAWGFEDLDLFLRLGCRGVEIKLHGAGLHISHGDDVRDIPLGRNKYESDTKNRATSLSRIASGNVRGTYIRDVERWQSTRCRRHIICED
jgi:N-terminal domain of galactosyltransferase